MKILITQNHFEIYSGSELVTLELYEYFKSQKHFVQIFTNYISSRFAKEIKDQKIEIFDDSSFEDNQNFDLIWIHHGALPKKLLLKSRLNSKFVFHHMSPFEKFELPFLLNIESKNCIILSNSEETKKRINELGLVNKKINILNNPAPTRFFKSDRIKRPLKNLLIVSNHLPMEAIQALNVLQNRYSIRSLGLNELANEGNRRLSIEDLDWADAIFSIAKTIQYGIVSLVPSYVYDIHGGPGWINTKETFNRSLKFNFSGRGFEKKTPEQIILDIENIQLFQEARDLLYNFSDQERLKFTYEKKMELVWNLIYKAKKRTINQNEKHQWLLTKDLISREYRDKRNLFYHYNELDQIYKKLDGEYKKLDGEYKKLDGEYKNLQQIRNLIKLIIKKIYNKYFKLIKLY